MTGILTKRGNLERHIQGDPHINMKLAIYEPGREAWHIPFPLSSQDYVNTLISDF